MKIRKRDVFLSMMPGASVTSKIIVFNVSVFILSFFVKDIFNYVALVPGLIVQGKNLWTILTSMFVHAGFAHLFFNMISLFFVGTFIERIIGKKRFFWFYMISGIIAGLFFALLSGFFGFGLGEKIFGNPDIGGVGASGAIFGLVGLIAVLTPRNRVYLIVGPLIAIIFQSILGIIFPDSSIVGMISLLITVYIFFSIFAMFSFDRRMRKAALPVEMPFWLLPIVAIVPLVVIGMFFTLPIGNMAHLGGLVTGLVYGVYLRRKYSKKVKMLDRMFR